MYVVLPTPQNYSRGIYFLRFRVVITIVVRHANYKNFKFCE
jgi:hypothetical protein